MAEVRTTLGATSTDGQLYFIGIKTGERLDIQFVPYELRQSRNADIGTIEIVGRNNPLLHYSGGSDKLDFELDFLAEDESREDAVKKINWLKRLAMNDGYKKGPENVKLVFGRLFRTEIWRVISVDVTWSNFHQPKGFMPIQAYVRITLMLDTLNNSNYSDYYT